MSTEIMVPRAGCFAIVFVAASIYLQACAASNQIRHLEQNHEYLVDTGPANWAISSPSLAKNGWKTVSLNKDKVTIWTTDCQTSVKSPQELSSAEKSLVNSIRDQLNGFQASSGVVITQSPNQNQQQQQMHPSNNNNHKSVVSQQQQQHHQQVSSPTTSATLNYNYYSSSNDGSHSQLVADHPIDSLSYQNQQITIDKHSDSFSISKPGLPHNLARVFVDNDLITYVYLNGEVLMKPTSCLQADELEFMNKLKTEVQQSQKHMEQYWTTFNQNMQQNMNNLQQNFDTMNQNLQNSMADMQQRMQQTMSQNWMSMFPNSVPIGFSQPSYRDQLYQAPQYGNQQLFGQMAPLQQPSIWMQNQMQPALAPSYPTTGLPYPYSNNLLQFSPPQAPYMGSNFFNTLPGPSFPFYGQF